MADTLPRDPVIELLDTTQRETQDLVTALCQVHLERVRELLSRDLHAQMIHVIEERFSQLELSIRPRMARARLEVARGITQVLNDCFARMRRFDSDRAWCEAMLDAAGALSRRSAFFSVRGNDLCLQGARGFEGAASVPPLETPYKSAPAFVRVIEMGKTQIATRTAAELSAAISEMFGNDSDVRVMLVPVTTADRVPGIIYAEDAVDASAIETVAAMAGAVLERHLRLYEPVRPATGGIRTVSVVGPDGTMEHHDTGEIPAQAPPPTGNPIQKRAQRFARVEVARILLEQAEAVARGRHRHDLYQTLRQPIDSARARYREQFDGIHDYLHLEILRTLAREDTALLGRDYPGPLG